MFRIVSEYSFCRKGKLKRNWSLYLLKKKVTKFQAHSIGLKLKLQSLKTVKTVLKRSASHSLLTLFSSNKYIATKLEIWLKNAYYYISMKSNNNLNCIVDKQISISELMVRKFQIWMLSIFIFLLLLYYLTLIFYSTSARPIFH